MNIFMLSRVSDDEFDVALHYCTHMSIIGRIGATLRGGTSAPSEESSAARNAAVERSAGANPEIRGPQRTAKGTLRLGVLPDFLIIGAMKCGTTSLYNWLAHHQQIAPTNPKEIHFFDSDKNFLERGVRWYRAHFPVGEPGRTWISGEATPAYLFDPRVTDRVAGMVPDAKLIVLLRDPVSRAVSHWNHQVSRGREADDLAAALTRVMTVDAQRDSADRSAKRNDYLRRGHYAEQLERWWQRYDREQTLVLHSDEMFADPAETLDQVCEFLELPPMRPLPEFTARNVGTYRGKMDEDLRQRLVDYYRPHNQRLYDLLGIDYGWERRGSPAGAPG